jgi:glycosyltransferase involved in cell wall biosynthesis
MMISVIVSAYKDRGYLDDAIVSALRQSFQDYEIILSSDGDPTLAKYAEKYKIDFLLSPKGNHSTALNNAVRYASGEWIKELHDDDLLTENCLTDLWNARGDYDLIHASAINFEGKDVVIKRYKAPEDITLKSLLPIIHCPVHAATIMFKRQVFLDCGGFDPNINCSEEYDFYLNLLTKGYRFGTCKSIVAWYRIHGEQVTTGYTKEKRAEVIDYLKKKYGL